MKSLLAGLLAFLLLAPSVMAAPDFPALTGRVVDGANILSAATEQALTQKLAALEAANSRQLVVVTLASLGGYDISDYGYQLGRHWGIGQEKLNNGALLIVAPNERRVRIEVGYGLEPILTDAMSSVIINTQITPRFRQGDYDGGVTAGVDALIEQMTLEPSEAEKRAAAAAQSLRDGGQEEAPGFAAVLLILFALFFLFGRNTALWPLLFLVAGSGRGGGYHGGGGRGGFGGGGFRGGGGGFGGGGASGGW